MNTTVKRLRTRINLLLYGFIAALVLSGITAFPLTLEVNWLCQFTSYLPNSLSHFIQQVATGINHNAVHFPFMQYGTDWLAFAHIVIAIAFLGPLKDPVRNIWVIEFGIISCILLFPLAFICGSVRGIPLLWQLVDCSFGLIGLFPLIWIHRLIRQLQKLTPHLSSI